MFDFQLLLVTVLKALMELAALFLLGQGALYVLAGRKRDTNLFYQLFRILTRPIFQLTRAVTPKVIIDRHLPAVAFLLVFWLWVVFTLWKVELCTENGQNRCVPQADAVSWRRPPFPV